MKMLIVLLFQAYLIKAFEEVFLAQ